MMPDVPWWMPELNKAGAEQGLILACSGLLACLGFALCHWTDRWARVGVVMIVVAIGVTTYAKIAY